jgi:hypothetical protein
MTGRATVNLSALVLWVMVPLAALGPQASAGGEESQDITILFIWGVGGKNRLDTASASLTKDLVIDPAITVSFSLTQEEKLRILGWADSLGFFDLPDHIAPPDTSDMGCIQVPCSQYSLTVATSSRHHTSEWSDCNCSPCAERDRALSLAQLVERLVQGKEEYRRLPKARGGYM